MAPHVLILWDIDHTLIETRGLGRTLYHRAFVAATGTPLARLAPFAGRTELDIMSDTLRLNGHDPTDTAIQALAAALVHAYDHARDELRRVGRVLPGAQDTLELLSADPDLCQSVLTGNVPEVARIKLDTFDLSAYLDLAAGAYGVDHRDRSALVHIAQDRAHARTGIRFDNDRTVLIGDTPNDVHAARTAGAQVIGVATGTSDPAELHAAGAPIVFPDLTDAQAVHTAIRDLAARR